MAIGLLRPEAQGRVERVERRAFIQAPPRVVWATLHDPEHVTELFPELRLGPAGPAWPAAATVRQGRARLGLLRTDAVAESLEARPGRRFRLRVAGPEFESEWRWELGPRAGGTRVVHVATLEPSDRLATLLVRLGRDSLADRVEAHLLALKQSAETVWRSDDVTLRGHDGESDRAAS